MSKKTQLLELLKASPRTTYELCINGFAASYRQRIDDLRKEGYEIIAESKRVEGQVHTVWKLRSFIPEDLFACNQK